MTNITIPRALLEQMLDALTNLTAHEARASSIWQYFHPTATGDYVNLREFRERAAPVATILRSALEQPQQVDPDLLTAYLYGFEKGKGKGRQEDKA